MDPTTWLENDHGFAIKCFIFFSVVSTCGKTEKTHGYQCKPSHFCHKLADCAEKEWATETAIRMSTEYAPHGHILAAFRGNKGSNQKFSVENHILKKIGKMRFSLQDEGLAEHGRRESRAIGTTTKFDGYVEFPGIQQCFRVERKRGRATKGKPVGEPSVE